MNKQVLINTANFTKERNVMCFEVPLSELSCRVSSMLSGAAGVCEVELAGQIDSRSNPTLFLTLKAMLGVTCQRCLNSMIYEMHTQASIVLYKDQDSLDAALDKDDDLDAILFEDQLDVMQLIEDEIIMCFPLAPKHEQCNNAFYEMDKKKCSPFALLSKLKAPIDKFS